MSTRPSWLFAAACVVASYLLITGSHFTLGELAVDDAATFFVAVHPVGDLLTLPVASQGQPPLFFLALHEWLHAGDTEPVLRLLPLAFMLCAAATLLCTSWLTPATRVVSLAVLLLSGFSLYLTPTLRPYSLSVWFSLWSCLSLGWLLRDPRRGAAACLWYIVPTLALAYSLTLAVWTLIAQGLFVVGVVVLETVRRGTLRAVERYGAVLLSLAIVALLYVPHGIGFLRFQSALGRPSLWLSLVAAFNPRHFVSGPIYLLTMPGGLGVLAAALAAVGVLIGTRDRDPLVGLLLTVIAVQIAATHGSLAGRYSFSFRYLTPAYPALCLLAGLGAGWCLAMLRRADLMVGAGAVVVLALAAVAFARAPHVAPESSWRRLAVEFRAISGQKFVFFETGWEAQPLRYETRRDPDVHMRNQDGPGWKTFGQVITPDYVTQTIDREAVPGTRWFYHVDVARGSRIFDETFVPAMARHRCARVSERAVESYETEDFVGNLARLYGYACAGT